MGRNGLNIPGPPGAVNQNFTALPALQARCPGSDYTSSLDSIQSRLCTKGGVSTLTVGSDNNDGMGEYTLQLWDVPMPDLFAISVGDSISNGVPAAGNIELPGVRDMDTFNATPNIVVTFTIDALEGNITQLELVP